MSSDGRPGETLSDPVSSPGAHERTGESSRRIAALECHLARDNGQPAFEDIYGMHAFDYYARFPEKERSQVHEEAMATMTRQSDAAIMDAYDFSRFATVADVGGGNGALLASLLLRHPNLRGILFDLPHVVATSTDVLRKAGVADRCQVVAGSFFESVLSAADAYVLKRIIHDWDDERATMILTKCREATTGSARVLVIEEVLPERATPTDAPSFLLDLEMLTVTPGGRERTEEDFRRLFQVAGLRLNRVVPTGYMRVGVVEGVPA